MDIVKCSKCGAEIEIDKALEGQIEARIITELSEKHRREIQQTKEDAR